ncbi:MAG: MAPEG family protein [Novosphingobium sp.]|nr:MAPEG family protein [Novosphingobium sp.]
MHTEVMILAWGAVLLVIHIFAAAHVKTKQYGTDWNIGPRDEPMPPLNEYAGRLKRAQDNFMETFPVAIVALVGVVIAGRTSGTTVLGGWIWLVARVIYLPIYYAGIKGLRTGVFLVSLLGLGMVIWPLLIP